MKKLFLFSTMLMLSFLSCTKENSQFASYSDVNNLGSLNTPQSLTSAGCDDIILNMLIVGNTSSVDYDAKVMHDAARDYFACIASNETPLSCGSRFGYSPQDANVQDDFSKYAVLGTGNTQLSKQRFLENCKAVIAKAKATYGNNIRVISGGSPIDSYNWTSWPYQIGITIRRCVQINEECTTCAPM